MSWRARVIRKDGARKIINIPEPWPVLEMPDTEWKPIDLDSPPKIDYVITTTTFRRVSIDEIENSLTYEEIE